jgi:hypothetical protein
MGEKSMMVDRIMTVDDVKAERFPDAASPTLYQRAPKPQKSYNKYHDGDLPSRLAI